MDLNPLDDYAFRSQRLNMAVYLAIMVVAMLLRSPHFSSLAVVGSDPAIYTYCAEHKIFPHAPYVIYTLVGLLLKNFVRLDWGYSVVSMISSLVSVLFFAWSVESLYRSRVAGWVAGFVLACTPICVRLAGIQEVYALQFLFLSMTWYVCSGGNHPLLAGLLFGTTMATHSGVIFALPTTLLLLWKTTHDRVVSVTGEGGEGGSSSLEVWIPRQACVRAIVIFLVAAGAVGLHAVGWIAYLWITTPGAPELSYLPVFLRGSAPSLDWNNFSQGGVIHHFLIQIIRVWSDLSDFQVIGAKLLTLSILALLLHPWRITAPWWLLSLPYLFYEILVTRSLDAGIYCVFIVPALAAGLGLCAIVPREVSRTGGIVALTLAILQFFFDVLDMDTTVWIAATLSVAFLVGRLQLLTTARVTTLLLGLFFAINDSEDFQSTAKVRNLMPWYREQGAPFVLSAWVRENTPKDTIVCHPMDWLYSPYSAPLYSGREPIFRGADRLALTPWRPLMQALNALPLVTIENIESWLSQGRPMVSYDPEPFTGYLTYWRPEFSERYEARPILWLNRNQSGTSDYSSGCQTLVSVDIGDATAERQVNLRIPDTAVRTTLCAPVYHPTLYWIARRTDKETPTWVRELENKVPSDQWGAPPQVRDEGIGIEKSKAVIFLDLPAIPGKTHILRQRIQSGGLLQFVTNCSIEKNGKWIRIGADMEQIMGPPDLQFTDFFFQVPGDTIRRDHVTLQLSAAHGCKEINVFQLDWAAARDGSPNP
jgi:hypothetical protein